MIPMRNGARVLTLAAVALLVSAGLFGQAETRKEKREEAKLRNVMGVVLDAQDQPANGAVVQLKDMRTLQVRSFITQNDGAYHFTGLRPDIDYQITAKLGDMTAAPRTLSIFDNTKDAVRNFKLDKPEKK